MKRLLSILVFIVPLSLFAQSLFSPNQAMVKGAVEQSVVVVCSAYELQDSTGQRYGRSNRAEFSQSYTLGVVTDSGLVVSHSVMQPWLFDDDFSRYRQAYKPVWSAVSCRQTTDSVYTSIGLSADNIPSPLLMRMPNDTITFFSPLSLHTDTTFKNGWLLWVYVSDTLGKVGTTSTTAVMSTIQTVDSMVTVSAPSVIGMSRDSLASRKVVGAVWVVPSYPKAGIVQFRVAGLVVRNEVGWVLAPLQFTRQSAIVVPIQDNLPEEELTPSPDQQQMQKEKNKRSKDK